VVNAFVFQILNSNMNKILLTLTALIISLQGFSQTALPTSFNFDTFSGQASLPTGWTTNITGTYTYATGQAGPAGKFDQQGEFVQIQTADPIGTLNYYLKGNYGTPATLWSGTFKVQESINGTTWTDLASYTSLNSTAYQAYSVSPASASRYIRFYFDTKVTGCNVGLDEVNATLGAQTNREINVKQNGNTIFNGGSAVAIASPSGTPTIVAFTIENQGTAEILNVSSVTFTGANASDYSVTTSSFSVNGVSSLPLNVSFTPSGNGTRFATMNIASNDADEPIYSIVLNCVGGSFATEPTSPAYSLTFSNIKSYRYSATLTGLSDADGYLVVRKAGSVPTGLPVDGTSYGKGDPIGDGKAVYVGNDGTFSANEVVENTTYYYTVYSYNGAGAVRNYLTSSVLNEIVTSATNNAGSLYSGINTANTTFVNDLHSLINPHTSIFYGNYDETVLRNFEARDTAASQRVVTCVYSGLQYVYTEQFNWSVMAREHMYCHSWMPTNPADSPEKPEYNDQHNLFPTQFENANQVRLDYPLGEVVNPSAIYLGCKLGLNVNGDVVFEPRDEHKGDAARALFYMATCYNGVSGNNWSLPNTSSRFQDQNILRNWHYQDLPSAYEKARNEFIDSLQGNRNPFIDHPEYACFINFETMEYIPNAIVPCNNSIILNSTKVFNDELLVYPNPTSSNQINIRSNKKIASIQLSNLVGQVVYSINNPEMSNQISSINIEKFPKGIYYVNIVNQDQTNSVKKISIR